MLHKYCISYVVTPSGGQNVYGDMCIDLDQVLSPEKLEELRWDIKGKELIDSPSSVKILGIFKFETNL